MVYSMTQYRNYTVVLLTFKVPDSFKVPFHQQMHFLLNIQNVKIYIKISYMHSYVFRSSWTKTCRSKYMIFNVNFNILYV